MHQLRTIDQAAEQLACTPAAIRRWLSQGRLRRVKVGRLTRLRQTDLEAVAAGGGLRPAGTAR
jgi:excisionase family DNA binding protein